MKSYTSKRIFILISVIFLTSAALFLKVFSANLDPEQYTLVAKAANNMRIYIYLGLLFAWTASVAGRVVDKKTKKILILIAALMIFWLVVREIKYRYVINGDVIRYLWYSYYIPMIMIPALFLRISVPDDRKRPFYPIYIIAAAIILSVLTNDFHMLFFAFPAEGAWSEFDYRYGPIYYVFLVFVAFCILFAYILTAKKSKMYKKSRYIILPVIPLIILAVYGVMYTFKIEPARFLFGDFAVVLSYLITVFFEISIQIGLIQSNARYRDLFESGEVTGALIVDAEGEPVYTSGGAETDTGDSEEKEPFGITKDGKIVYRMPISGGEVIWSEDISELMRLNETLNDRKEELKERNNLLQLEYEREKEHKIIEEQNKLFDLLQSKTQRQIDKIGDEMSLYKSAKTQEEKRDHIEKILILGSYIKRRKDFVLSIESVPVIQTARLSSALDESYHALHLHEIKGAYTVDMKSEYAKGEILTGAYDFFEYITEASLDGTGYINTYVGDVGGNIRITVTTDAPSPKDTSERYPKAVVSEDDGMTRFSLVLGKGGVK